MRLSRLFGFAVVLGLVSVSSLCAQSPAVGYAIITPLEGNPAGLTAVETLFDQTASGTAQTALAASPLITSLALTVNYGSTVNGSTGLAIVNPSSGQATINLSLTDTNGNPLATRTVSLVPNGQSSAFLNEWFAGQIANSIGGTGLLLVSSDLPVGITALNFAAVGFASLPMMSLSTPFSVPVTTTPLSTTRTVAEPITLISAATSGTAIGGAGALVFPQVVSGGGWSTSFAVANTSTVSQTIRIDFFSSTGVSLGSVPSVVIPSRGLFSFSSGANGIISGQ